LDFIAGLLPDSVGLIIAVALIVASFFTSALTASFGLGGGMAMLALMGALLPVATLIPVHGAVQLGSNGGRAWHQRKYVRMDVVVPFAIGSVAGAIAGFFFVVQLPDALLKLVMGGFVLALTWLTIPRAERIGGPALMLASTGLAILSMFVGATGPLVSALFAQVMASDRRALIATHGAAMIAQHGLKVVVFALAGFAFHQWLPLIIAMIASGFLGTVYGTKLLDLMPEAIFRKWFRAGISLLALDMLRQGIMGYL